MTTNNEKCATVLTQHWHRFALSAQIRICYTEDAQKHIKTESCCEQTPVLGVCFLHREKKRRSIFEHFQQLTAASAAEEKSGALALCCMARRQHFAASDSAGFGHDDLGKGDGDHEGRLSANSSHLHHRCHRHRVRRTADDEFLHVDFIFNPQCQRKMTIILEILTDSVKWANT